MWVLSGRGHGVAPRFILGDFRPKLPARSQDMSIASRKNAAIPSWITSRHGEATKKELTEIVDGETLLGCLGKPPHPESWFLRDNVLEVGGPCSSPGGSQQPGSNSSTSREQSGKAVAIDAR